VPQIIPQLPKAAPREKELVPASKIKLSAPPGTDSRWKGYYDTHAQDGQLPRFKMKDIKKRKSKTQEDGTKEGKGREGIKGKRREEREGKRKDEEEVAR